MSKSMSHLLEETYITLNGANSSVGNLKANLHRLGISEGSNSGCSMSTTSEEMAPDEEAERFEISKYDKFVSRN